MINLIASVPQAKRLGLEDAEAGRPLRGGEEFALDWLRDEYWFAYCLGKVPKDGNLTD